jgi:hypothetical protein
VTFESTDFARYLALDPAQFIGIPIALVGAVFMSFGAQYQHRGVAKVEANTTEIGNGGLNVRQLALLLKRPSWVFGTLMLSLAIVFQLVALVFSPLVVVQPLGAVALVITTVLNARITHVKPTGRSFAAICLCVGGVGAFVAVAAFTTRNVPVTEGELITILAILGSVLVVFALVFALLRNRFKAIVYVVGAGVLYGFVATLAKVVIARVQQSEFDWLTAVCVVGLVAAVGLGAYFVQNAYSSGPPDLVIAGLTVIDPMVAVAIGILVLHEAAEAPLWAAIAFVITGVVAVVGVFMLARYHPQVEF